MLNLNLNEVARAEVRLQGGLPADVVVGGEQALGARGPFEVDLTARAVGGGVLVRGRVRGRLELACRRCLAAVEVPLDEEVTLWFEEDESGKAQEEESDVYPLPARGHDLDITEPLREQLLLAVPQYVLCREECAGLCPQCGADLNQGACGCVAEPTAGPWDALKSIKFD